MGDAGLYITFALVGLAIGWVYYQLVGEVVARVFLRAALALVPVAMVATVLVLFVVRNSGLEPDVQRALIAAIAVAAGWVVTYVTAEWRRVATEQERRRDIVEAVITEVELIRKFGQRMDWTSASDEMIADFHKDRRHRIFIYYGQQYGTLKRLVGQIEILRRVQIGPVMDLFQALDRIDRMQDRMENEGFHNLDWSRRLAAGKRYLTLNEEIPSLCDAALVALKKGPFAGLLGRRR